MPEFEIGNIKVSELRRTAHCIESEDVMGGKGKRSRAPTEQGEGWVRRRGHEGRTKQEQRVEGEGPGQVGQRRR